MACSTLYISTGGGILGPGAGVPGRRAGTPRSRRRRGGIGPPGPVMAIRRLVMAASAGAPSISPRSFCFSALSSAASARPCSQAARCAWARSRSAPPSSPSTRADSRSPRWLMAPPQDQALAVQATTAESLAMERRGGPAVLERGAQLGPAAVDPAAHTAQLHAQGGRDLLVGEALDVA